MKIKKLLIGATFVWVMASPSSATGQDLGDKPSTLVMSEPLEIEPKLSLYTAIRKGYKILDIIVHTSGSEYVFKTSEIFYLQKGRDVLQCATMNIVVGYRLSPGSPMP